MKYEAAPGVEINKYVDTILYVLYRYSGYRKVVISSFHVDIVSA